MTATSASMRRGACPGLSDPMPTGDGLLARLMPIGTMSLDAMAGLSAVARRHGNGIVEITSRGSIQIRGLTRDSAPGFADSVAELSIAAHDGVPIIADPLTGLAPGELIDAGALAAELRNALAADPVANQLSAKVSVAIDGGGALHLDALTADIRLRAVATADGSRLHVAVGGDAANAIPLRTIAPADVADTVIGLLREIAAHGRETRARDVIRAPAGAAPLAHVPAKWTPVRRQEHAPNKESRACSDSEGTEHALGDPADPIGQHRLRGNKFAVGLGFPFGHTTIGLLNSLLRTARDVEATGVRTAPGRALLVIGLTLPDAEALTAAARRLDFIVEPGDPRRRVVACAGAPICASGQIEARGLAPEVAQAMLLMRRHETIHISGCAKSCAYQGVATLTAVGRGGACDLFVEGAPAGSCETWQLARRLGQIAVDRLPRPSLVETKSC